MNRCPVCGYPELGEPAYDGFGDPSFDICDCCGTQFGYEDAGRSHEFLRDEWIAKGMPWWNSAKEAPLGWDPVQQLRSLTEGAGGTAGTTGSARDDTGF